MQVETDAVERRRHPRTVSPSTAIVKSPEALHRYIVSNLSVSGALLSDGPALSMNSLVEVVLCLPLYPEIRVQARVVRIVIHAGGACELAVEFVHKSDTTEDHIQSALLSELERSRTDGVVPADLRPS